ncbi:MAG: hypothetical protein ACSLFI_00390 [Solirubrobacterales bacterium]
MHELTDAGLEPTERTDHVTEALGVLVVFVPVGYSRGSDTR